MLPMHEPINVVHCMRSMFTMCHIYIMVVDDSADCWDAEEAETTTPTSPVSAPKVEPQVTTPVILERKRPRPYGGKTKATYLRRGSGRNAFRGGGRRLMEGGMIPEV